METLLHYKSQLVLRRKKVKDLAKALNMEYSKVSRVLNGFQAVPADFDRNVRKIFDEWDHRLEGRAAEKAPA
jgi:DNA-binding LacI/PurR family transcriptional regulator